MIRYPRIHLSSPIYYNVNRSGYLSALCRFTKNLLDKVLALEEFLIREAIRQDGR
jgi:hypothetical protein